MNIGDAAFAKYWADSIVEQVRGRRLRRRVRRLGVARRSCRARRSAAGAASRADAACATRRLPELQGRTYVEAWESFIVDARRDSRGPGRAAHSEQRCVHHHVGHDPLRSDRGRLRRGLRRSRLRRSRLEGFDRPRARARRQAKDRHPPELSSTRPTTSTAGAIILANYLLVKGDRTYLDYWSKSPLEWYPEWEPRFRPAAVDARRRSRDLASGGVYRRDFERGVALVNPGSAPVTVALGAPMKRVEPAGGGVIDDNGAAARQHPHVPGRSHRRARARRRNPAQVTINETTR